jgi:tol-pal system protein YbgF
MTRLSTSAPASPGRDERRGAWGPFRGPHVMVIACAVAILSTGCATRDAVRLVGEDLRATQAEVDRLRQAQDELSRLLIETTASAQATRAKTEELQATLNATRADLDRLLTRLDATDDAVDRMREAVAVNAAALPPPLAPPAVPERPRENRIGSAETAYAAGLAAFRAREYGQAVLDFLDVVTKHPAHGLAPTSQYWIGEAYYVQRDYRQALVEFQRVIDWGPPNSKAAEALVKAGLCYSHLREGGRAQEAWRRVLREFPESPAAAEARTLLVKKGPVSPAARP